ncbi:MAG: mechanosensitive ion channel family protein, partial [Candidatus Delongbacteria bacterium]|nr:mechanosensitive ion channel family protein [Candidatus Delongbacteria bacterium]
RILKDPAHFIGLKELGDSSVNFAVRAWVNAADYWGVFFDLNEKYYKRSKDYDLNIPFPQMDVHLDK